MATRYRGATGIGSLVLICSSFVPIARAQTLLEPGYTLTPLPSGIGAAGLACSPGGTWGDFVYVADSQAGTIDRIDSADIVESFAGPFSFPVGLEFGPGPGNDFGDLLYVGDFGASEVNTVTNAGEVQPFASFPGPGALAFDPSGASGTQLFAASPVAGSIRAIDSAGNSSLSSSVASGSIGFGPGAAWSDELYATDHQGSVSGPDCCFDHEGSGCTDAVCQASVCAADPACCGDAWGQSCANLALEDGACPCTGYGPGIVRVGPGGTPTPLADGFVMPQGFDWAEGAGWNGDLFAADLAEGVLRRVTPGGSATDFALFATVSDVAFCNCALYVVSLDGGRFRITSDADDPDMDGSGEACDTCPGVTNPPGTAAVFPGQILASNKTTFSWTDVLDVRYVRGPLATLESYAIDLVESLEATKSFTDLANPSAAGAGFFYLAQPLCPEASWQTVTGGQPDRDASLP